MPLVRAASSFALALAFGVTAAPVLDAQAGSHAPSCTDSIPASDLRLQAAYIEASRPDDAPPAMASEIANFTQSIADHAQRLLGGDGSSLPPVEPRLRWPSVFGGIVVTAHKDGTYDAVPEPVGADDTGERFLVQAVDAMRVDGEPFLWPADASGDAVSFVVAYKVWPLVTIGPIHLVVPLPAVPAFSVETAIPHAAEAIEGAQRKPAYPEIARSSGASGSIALQFVVDTNGRAVQQSVKLLETPGGSHGVFQHAFFEAARSAVIGSRYRPAHVGPCPVRQLVQQAFVFNFNDPPLPRTR